MKVSSDCSTPSPSPAAAAPVTLASLPTSIAVSPGTTSCGTDSGFSGLIDEARIITTVVTVIPPATFTTASRVGDHRLSVSAASSSSAARVAAPSRVRRYAHEIATASASTVPASQNRSCGTLSPAMSTGPSGNNGCSERASWPKWSKMPFCRYVISPSDAMSFATSGACRSDRKISSCTSIPSTAASTTATTAAAHPGSGSPSGTRAGITTSGSTRSPVVCSSANANAPHIASAACAKLMIPAPW
nr:hypothetical protein [Amycolatopsis jejuensis]